MRVECPWTRQSVLQRFIPSLFLSAFIVWLLLPYPRHEPLFQLAELEQKYPFLWNHVHINNGTGGGACMASRSCEFIANDLLLSRPSLSIPALLALVLSSNWSLTINSMVHSTALADICHRAARDHSRCSFDRFSSSNCQPPQNHPPFFHPFNASPNMEGPSHRQLVRSSTHQCREMAGIRRF